MGEAKRKKVRECPAIGGELTPEDCGRGRNSRYGCPVECSHNPFGNAGGEVQMEVIEARVTEQLGDRLIRSLPAWRVRELQQELENGRGFQVQCLEWKWLFEDERLSKWMAEGWHHGFRNDDQVLLSGLLALRADWLEVRGEAGPGEWEVRRVSGGETFRLKGIQPQPDRFEVGLFWYYPVPGGFRSFGQRMTVPPVEGMMPAEVIREMTAFLELEEDEDHGWLEGALLLADAMEQMEERGMATDLVAPKIRERWQGDAERREELARFGETGQEALGGKSPRQWAAERGAREALEELLRDWVRRCDWEAAVADGFDPNPLLEELGYPELVKEANVRQMKLAEPPPQPVLGGEALQKRMDAVMSDVALWNRLEVRLGDVLETVLDFESFNDEESEAVMTAILLAVGAMHPRVGPDFEPDLDRMAAWYERQRLWPDAEETTDEFLDRLYESTCQPEVAAAAGELLDQLSSQKGSKIRAKRLEAMLTAVAAAIWETAHWPVAV